MRSIIPVTKLVRVKGLYAPFFTMSTNNSNKKLVESYLKDVQLGRHGERPVNSDTRLDRISSTLSFFIEHYFASKPVKKITQTELEEFFLKYRKGEIKKESGEAYSMNTIVSNWKIWRKFYAYVCGWDTMELPLWLRKLKIKENGIEKPIDRGEFATKEKMELICENMRSQHNRIVLKSLFDWGISYGELKEVKLKQLHYDKEKSTFYISITSGFKDAREDREISYTWYEPDFILYLKDHPDWDFINNKPIDKEAFLFPQKDIASINKALKRTSMKLFGEVWTTHWMRRGLITHLNDSDVPESAIKYRCGLSENTKVLSHYNKRSKKRDDLLKQALARSTTDKLEFESKLEREEQAKKIKLQEEQLKKMQEEIKDKNEGARLMAEEVKGIKELLNQLVAQAKVTRKDMEKNIKVVEESRKDVAKSREYVADMNKMMDEIEKRV